MILELIAAYIGYRRWGTWRGAVVYVLYLWLIYIAVAAVLVSFLFLSGDRIQSILSDAGNSI
jgi:hypothetical protein